MTQVDQIDQDSFTVTMQVNNIIYQMVYPLPQHQLPHMNQYWDTHYPTQVFFSNTKPDGMGTDVLATNYVHASMVPIAMDTSE